MIEVSETVEFLQSIGWSEEEISKKLGAITLQAIIENECGLRSSLEHYRLQGDR